MKKNCYYVNPLQACVCLATILVSAVLAVTLITMNRLGPAVLFLAITLLFTFVFLSPVAKITVEKKGISRSLFGKPTKFLGWDEIAEIGVAGSKIFGQINKEQTGSIYIYISEHTMSDEERFNMMLNWPPKDKLFLQYTKERMDTIQMNWSKKIQTYNSGNLRF